MHRALGVLLIPALMATSGVPASPHVHAYINHDHPEHHHGLAVHEHHAAAAHHETGVTYLEGCDPDHHTLSVAFVCGAPPQGHAPDAEVDLPASRAPALLIGSAVAETDVRVHGPPPRPQASPRAPPVTFPA